MAACIQQVIDNNHGLQEHLAAMRKLAIAFPARFPELASLSNADEEVDFFRNVAHIQLHRRSRALSRLVKVGAVLLVEVRTEARWHNDCRAILQVVTPQPHVSSDPVRRLSFVLGQGTGSGTNDDGQCQDRRMCVRGWHQLWITYLWWHCAANVSGSTHTSLLH